MPELKKIPRKYHPKGYEILYDDRDIIVGNKAPGFLTVGAPYDRENTIHHALNLFVRKGNSRSHKRVYVVHRLDRETSGVLVFAKTEDVQTFLKDDWKNTTKIYYAVVHGRLAQKSGTLSSYLAEDEDYMMHSSPDSRQGKLAQTAYTVVKETDRFSLVKIDLLTGRKNQIRVHFADARHPLVGDSKYGKPDSRYERLALHAQEISLNHPFSKQRMTFTVDVPDYFRTLVGPW